jgi:hypothetical protein
LQLHGADLDINADQHQVPTVLLDHRADHLYEVSQLSQALGPFLIAQHLSRSAH